MCLLEGVPDPSLGNPRSYRADFGIRFAFTIFLDMGHVNLGASATSAVLHQSAEGDRWRVSQSSLWRSSMEAQWFRAHVFLSSNHIMFGAFKI